MKTCIAMNFPLKTAFIFIVSGGHSLAVVYGLFIAVASLLVEHMGMQAAAVAAGGLSSCSSWAPAHWPSSCGTRA